MIIFIHPTPKILFPRNCITRGISLAPKIWIARLF